MKFERSKKLIKAMWNGVLLAESDETIRVEGNYYFPKEHLKWEYFKDSATQTEYAGKGTAYYFDIIVGDKLNKDAAWYYPNPKPQAEEIKNMVAFSNGVEVK